MLSVLVIVGRTTTLTVPLGNSRGIAFGCCLGYRVGYGRADWAAGASPTRRRGCISCPPLPVSDRQSTLRCSFCKRRCSGGRRRSRRGFMVPLTSPQASASKSRNGGQWVAESLRNNYRQKRLTVDLCRYWK